MSETHDIGPLADFPGELIYKAKSDWFFALGSWAYESACARRKYEAKKLKRRWH